MTEPKTESMKPSVLVVDDEKMVRAIFSSMLQQAGYRVDEASGCDEAIEAIDREEYDLILTDIVLGERSGVDLLREVRQRRFICPVVMITGYPTLETAEEAVRLGAFDYIRKPVTYDRLVDVVRRAVLRRNEIAAEELRRSTRDAILKSVTESSIAVDLQSRVLDISGERDICGFPRDAEGRTLASLAGLCSGECVAAVRRAMETGKRVEGVRIRCGHAGRPGQEVLVNAYALTEEGDRTSGGVMLIRKTAGDGEVPPGRTQEPPFLMVGESQAMKKVFSLISALSDVQTTVLISGESGTGKELAARALHHWGSRATGPLVNVNCSALSEDLLESELFGHVRGAFTGAVRDKVGRFEKADGGTIFLDEVGDISTRVQMRLLRVLQEREFEMVGDSTPIRVDVRVVAATNRSLPEKVRAGTFREDLYYRLKVVEMVMPPLRERREDIPLLTEHFLRLFNVRFSREISGVDTSVMDLFKNYGWPGNIRELEHVIEHAFVHCRGGLIMLDHLPADLRSGACARPLEGPAERSEILKALDISYWNKTKAASLLGMSRRTIYRKIKEHNLKRG